MTAATESIALRADSSDIKRGIADLRALDRQAGKTAKAASSLGRTLGRAFAAISAGAAFRAVIQNTIEQERVTAQLNASLQSTGRYSEETSKALLAHAAALQQVTTYGDEAIISAQSQLLTFTKLGSEVFPRATEAILDLSAKMGTDLRSSVLQVGKALNDPIRGVTALADAGIQFTQTQRDMIKALVQSGDTLGAQKIILGELETQFGGSARAARDTFGGALKGLSNTLGDLLEADGDSLPGATRAINDLTDALNDPKVKAGFDTVTTGIVNMVAAAAQAPGVIDFLFDELKAGFGSVAADDIVRVEDRLGILQRRLDELGDGERGFWDRITGDGATRAEIEDEIKQLTKLVDDFYNTPREIEPTVTTIPGLDTPDNFDEVVVKTKKRTDELNDLIRASARASQEASEGLSDTLNSLAATIGGPPIQAAVRLSETLATLDQYEKTLQQTNALSVEKQQQLASARALANQEYQTTIELYEEEQRLLSEQLTYAEQVIADLEFEAELLGMTNQQRELAIALRYAEVDAMSEQGQAIGVLIGKIQQQRDEIEGLDFVKSAGQDAFASIIDGSKSAGDALDDFFARLRARAAQVLAEKLFETLFGAMGTTAGGGTAGTFGSILGSIFGGGRASGGNVMANRMYEVGEQGPELLRMGGRQFLIPGQSGNVVPNHQITNKSSTNNTRVTVLVAPDERRKTAAQLGNATARSIARSQARNS